LEFSRSDVSNDVRASDNTEAEIMKGKGEIPLKMSPPGLLINYQTQFTEEKENDLDLLHRCRLRLRIKLRAPRQTQKLRIRPAQEKGRERQQVREEKQRERLRAQSENVVVQKGVRSFSSAGIDSMTHWAAAVPAKSKTNPLFAPPKRRERRREAEI